MKKIILNLLCSVLLISSYAQTSIKLNPEINKPYSYQSIVKQTIIQSVNNIERTTYTENISYYTLKFLEKSNDFYICEIKFDSILIKTNSGGYNFNINSKKTGNLKSDDLSEVLNYFLNKHCNNSLFVKVSTTGKVIEIINYKIFYNIIMNNIDSVNTKISPIITNQLNNLTNEKTIKNNIESYFLYIPENENINLNDIWNINYTFENNGMSFDVNYNFKLIEINDQLIKINNEILMKSANKEPINYEGNKISNNLKGSGKGSYIIKKTDGMIKESNIDQRIYGSLTLEIQGNSMEMPTTIEINTKTQLIK